MLGVKTKLHTAVYISPQQTNKIGLTHHRGGFVIIVHMVNNEQLGTYFIHI